MRDHPYEPLRIFNYTEKAQFDGVWNNSTMTCRGLIVDFAGNVVARPFRKFWSIDQSESPNVPNIPWDESYRVFDKVDGSMGITYPTMDGSYAIATRGSFTSEQALHATKMWKERYADLIDPWLGKHPIWSLIFEIVYPENRIVVDYAGMDDLVLLGCVNIKSGRSAAPRTAKEWWAWPGPVVEEYPAWNVEKLIAQDRKDREGYVLWFPASDWRVKVKHDTYLQLHRIVTNANTKNVWRAWCENDLDTIYSLPDEFRAGIDAYLNDLHQRYHVLYDEAKRLYDSALVHAPGRERAEYVIGHASSKSIQAAVFAMINGKDHKRPLMRALEPAQAEPLWGLLDKDEESVIESQSA
jgi:RNA ligase